MKVEKEFSTPVIKIVLSLDEATQLSRFLGSLSWVRTKPPKLMLSAKEYSAMDPTIDALFIFLHDLDLES